MLELEGSVSSHADKENDISISKKSSNSGFSFAFPKFPKLRLKSGTKSHPYSNLYTAEESKGDFNKIIRKEDILELTKGLNQLQNQFYIINEQEANLADLIAKYIKDKSIKCLLNEQLYKYEKSVVFFKKKSTVLINKILKQKLLKKKKEKKDLLKEIKFLRKQLKSDATLMIGENGEFNELLANVENLEEKLDTLKERNEALNESYKNLNRENSHLKAELRKLKISHSLDEAIKDEEINRYKKTLDDCLRIGNNLLIGLKIPTFKAHDLYELMTFIRDSFKQVEDKLAENEENNAVMKMELESLREANMRLQENLQKSTTELDNLSKKLDGSICYEKEKNFLQMKCERLEKDIDSLKDKLRNTSKSCNCREHNHSLDNNFNQDILKKSSASEENILLKAKVEALNTIISKYESGGFGCRTNENTKNESLQAQVAELMVQNKHLTEKLDQMREDNANKLDQQHVYYQQIMLLQEELDITLKDNETLKQKLEAEHETLIYLKNERIKYLEEKNIIKQIFQQMRTEIERLQKLEGTMVDMSMEANRLAMIAEYNKELGEQLKNEVELRERTIWELTSKSDTKQRNSDEIKPSSSIPTKLTAKNSSLKKFLKHFANVTKERDVLLQNQEKYKQKFEELRKRVDKEHRTSEPLNHVKELQIQDLLKENEKLTKIIKEYQEKEIKSEKSNTKTEISHESIVCDKKMIELETSKSNLKVPSSNKHLSESEREQLENTVSYLKNTIQRLQHELDEARQQEKEYKDLYHREKDAKSELIARLDEEEIQVHNYEKMLKKSEEEIKEKENAIQQLSLAASELQDKVNECESLKISLQNVQGDKLELEKKHNELIQKYKECEMDLTNAKTEMNRLESHFKTAFRQMEEKKRILFREYQTKFDKISNQFVGLLQNLDKEKLLYQELAQEYSMVKRDLEKKDSACGHLSMNVMQAKDFIRMLQEEKSNMSEELKSLIDDYNILLEEKKEVENTLSDYQAKYNEVLRNYEMIEENMNQMMVELKETRKTLEEKNYELSGCKKKNQELNEELCQAHLNIISLKDNLFSLEERITSLEFQKCELTLQLREANGKLEIQSMVNNNLSLPPS